jgi:hypothetical protein
MNEKIVNITTGEEIIRQFTAEEIAVVQVKQTEMDAQAAADAIKAAAKQAVIDKLGLTAEEIAALLG